MFNDVMPQKKSSTIGQRIDFSENLGEVFRDLTIKLDIEVRARYSDLKNYDLNAPPCRGQPPDR